MHKLKHRSTLKTKRIHHLALITIFLSFSSAASADWAPYKNIKLEGLPNTIPGGSAHTEVSIPSGVYRFRIDPKSTGVDYATNQVGNTQSKSASLMVYTGTSKKDNTSTVTYYGLNLDGLSASSAMHAFPQQGGFSAFLSDWVKIDNSGSVILLVEKWED